MKKIFPFLLLILITFGCKCEETLTVYTLTEQEKTVVPYRLNDVVKWTDDNIAYNGNVIKITDDYAERDRDCDITKFNQRISYISFDDFQYSILLNKNNLSSIDLVVQEIVNSKVTKSFGKSVTLDSFTTIEFNGETYNNSVLLKENVLDGEPFGHLVYSKTNGIEFILFEDGTWYKRVE